MKVRVSPCGSVRVRAGPCPSVFLHVPAMMRFSQLECLGIHAAAMTMRADGDMSFKPPADTAAIASNRAIACRALGIDAADLVCAQQVHGRVVRTVTAADMGRGALDYAEAFEGTDGFLTTERGVPVTVGVADCVPLFLVTPDGAGGALLHAGREGTRQNIAEAGVQALCKAAGVRPGELTALIGPSAGPSYEVGPDIATDWRAAGLVADDSCLDLWRSNAAQLEAAGVSTERIHINGECTMTSGRFFSYRAGDAAARNMAVLVL